MGPFVHAPDLPPMNPLLLNLPDDVTGAADEALLRALRHHRRAIAALEDGTAFEGVSNMRSGILLDRLRNALRTYEAEAARRHLGL